MLDAVHHAAVHQRRVRVLARHLAELIPERASVLDVGTGDGLLARRVMDLRPDVRVRGVDVLQRPAPHIPVESFDGATLPFGEGAFDAVMAVDVLHHAAEQDRLLDEMVRVAKRGGALVIKDHVAQGTWARPTLALMDWVGNAAHGVALPYAYWGRARWESAFDSRGLRTVEYRAHLGLYPWPASAVFERGLHFMARLQRPST